MLLGLLQPGEVEHIMELAHHTANVIGGETAVFHRIDHIATAGVVAPRLGQHSRQYRITGHGIVASFVNNRGTPHTFS